MVESDASEGDSKDYWDRFTAYLEQLDRSPLTVKNYLSDLRAFEQWLKTVGHEIPNLVKVGSDEIRRYQQFLLTQQKLKPNSVNRRIGTLKQFYAWLQQTEVLTNDRRLHMPDPVKGDLVERASPLGQVEQQNLLEVVQRGQNQRDIAMIKLLLYTGIRAGELCGLRWADIEIETKKGRMLVRQPKSYRNRKIVLPPEVCAALLGLGYQTQVGSQAPVFIGQRGSMTPRGVQDVVRKYAKRAGLEKLTPHILRLTCLNRLVKQGMDSRTIAVLMGASAETLLHYYEIPSPVEE